MNKSQSLTCHSSISADHLLDPAVPSFFRSCLLPQLCGVNRANTVWVQTSPDPSNPSKQFTGNLFENDGMFTLVFLWLHLLCFNPPARAISGHLWPLGRAMRLQELRCQLQGRALGLGDAFDARGLGHHGIIGAPIHPAMQHLLETQRAAAGESCGH